MSNARPLLVFAMALGSSATAACLGTAPHYGPAVEEPHAAQPQVANVPPTKRPPAPFERVVRTFAGQGFACRSEPTRVVCEVPGSDWPLTVELLAEQDRMTAVWIDSYLSRPLARPCREFTNALSDLNSGGGNLQVTCDDTIQSFRLNTAFTYGEDLDPVGLANVHLQERSRAYRLLDAIGAIRCHRSSKCV